MPSKRETFLKQLALGAGKILLSYYEKKHKIEWKKDEGIVTEADKAAEAHLVKKILSNYPGSSIITEETGEYPGNTSLCWIIDPLDGTCNYAEGFPWFCVSIGLYDSGKPAAGVIFHPLWKQMFYTEKGKGVTLNGRRVKVSNSKKVEHSLLGTGFYYSKGKKLRDELKLFSRVSDVAMAVRRPGSAALDLAYVACGRYGGFWERGLKPWDVAAGMLMVQEAGGKITNYKGERTNIFESELLATNKKIHPQMTRILNA